MTAPDLFWAPLLGIYTGMRISEATQIRTDDVRTTPEGLHYIFVPKSKTTAGVRNVPICAALQQLGFLDYVDECRTVGADRIFPHCLLINNSYSKEVSAAMLAHQRALKIKAPHTSFHSFRVNVITAMANNGANTPQVMKIVGHKRGDSEEVHLGYVRDLPDLQPIVDALKWPINIPALTYDGRFGAFVANKDNWAKANKQSVEEAKAVGR
jgi:integrase